MPQSKLGLQLEQEWKLSFRRIRDDLAFNAFRIHRQCISIQEEVKLQEVLDRQMVEGMGEKW